MWDNISKKVSYHAVYDNSIEEAIYYAKDNGFTGIQLAIEAPHLSFENISDNQCKKIRKIAEKQQIYLTIHAPDTITSLFTYNNHLKQGIFSYFNDLFAFAEKIDAKLITIHLGDYPKYPTDTENEIEIFERDLIIYENTLHENLQRLLKLSDNRFIICIENYNLNRLISDILQVYLRQDKIWLCWDLPKTYNLKIKKIDENIERFFLTNKKSIKQVHLHDIDSNGKSHKVIKSGILDFQYFFNKLEIPNIMDFCIEVRPREKALESLQNLKQIINSKI